jgi:hypothetical protein
MHINKKVRPIPDGRITTQQAWLFCGFLSMLSCILYGGGDDSGSGFGGAISTRRGVLRVSSPRETSNQKRRCEVKEKECKSKQKRVKKR